MFVTPNKFGGVGQKKSPAGKSEVKNGDGSLYNNITPHATRPAVGSCAQAHSETVCLSDVRLPPSGLIWYSILLPYNPLNALSLLTQLKAGGRHVVLLRRGALWVRG